jgi:hypothetical protein
MGNKVRIIEHNTFKSSSITLLILVYKMDLAAVWEELERGAKLVWLV